MAVTSICCGINADSLHLYYSNILGEWRSWRRYDKIAAITLSPCLLVYKLTAGLNAPFFVFRESRIFVTPMVAAGWFAGG